MKKPVKAIIAGAVLVVGSLAFGIGGILIGMIRSFRQVASSRQPSSEGLTEAISASLFTTMIGIPIAFLGLCLLIRGVIT